MSKNNKKIKNLFYKEEKNSKRVNDNKRKNMVIKTKNKNRVFTYS